MTTIEDRAAALLDAASTGLAPDVDRLVGGGVARGRALRRRRGIATAIAAAAVVGVIGAAAGASPVLRGGAERAVQPPVAAPTPTAPTTSSSASAPRRFGIDRHKTAWVLVSLLPDGSAEALDAWGSDDPGDEYRRGVVLYEGAQVAVHLEHPDRLGDDSSPEVRCRALPAAECRELPEGDWYAVQRSGSGSPSAILSTTVTLFTPDGFALAATAWNAPAERGVEPVREQPVLDEAELLEVVQAPVWLDEQQ
jgi:hypothetical protein